MRGAGGEPVSFSFTINSHGLAALAPGALDESGDAYDLTVSIGTAMHTLRFTHKREMLHIESDRRIGVRDGTRIEAPRAPDLSSR